MSYSIFDVVKDVVSGTVKRSDQNLASKRISICEDCSEMNKILRTCKVCLCQCDAKTRFADASCPLNKW